MSNTKRSDDTSIHCIPFRGFLKGDARFLLFSVFMHENLLMSDIKSDPYANLSWIMPRTHEYFNLKGRFYIASAPIQITRFPPPKITKENASGYWEQERLRQWSLLDHQLRATFTWPSRTEVIDNKSLLCQSLPYDKSCLLIDIAMDNFCLLVYKVTEAEYLDYSIFPPKRMV
ncbi:uncharacterized protein B0P05DRAFT_459221, partial [Gilbertella persicaria]|uniref:uncharacterized protein n=1 Tax=Gilbertella persicaria TaxID=101096 RepID=UPI0022203A26